MLKETDRIENPISLKYFNMFSHLRKCQKHSLSLRLLSLSDVDLLHIHNASRFHYIFEDFFILHKNLVPYR